MQNWIGTNTDHCTIGGGYSNKIANVAIGGGTIPGGRHNEVAGHYGLAAGYHANAVHDGAFVWSDFSSANTFSSTAAHEFSVRAHGGARFVSGNGTGVTLAAGGGAWSSLSDRNAKTNHAAVNAREILAKVAALPVSTWNYKAQDASIRHLGPAAQDFHAAFGIGENDTTITTIDADGVALAAIQALNELVKEKDATLQAQKKLLRELADRLERLEKGAEKTTP